MTITHSNTWFIMNPDNTAGEIDMHGGVAPRVAGAGGTFAVCNHYIDKTLWMWYREYEKGVDPPSHEAVNHCATALFSYKYPSGINRVVHGPVVFTGFDSAPVSIDNIARLSVLANLARRESEKLGLEFV